MTPRLAANIDWLFTDLSPVDRVTAAASHGLKGIEILFPYGLDVHHLVDAVAATGVEVVLINSPAGDWVAGDRGLALGADSAAFEASIGQAAALAERLSCKRVHVLTGNGVIDTHWDRYISRLRWAAERLAESGITMCLEPINPDDMPGYGLSTPGQALRVLEALDHPGAALQLDLYHTWVTEGSVEPTLTNVIPQVGHVQIAGVPQRNEPDAGDVVLAPTLDRLEELGYRGWVGLEYRPRSNTSSGLEALLASVS